MSLLTAWLLNKESAERSSRPILSEILKTMRESVIVIGEDTRILASNTAAYNAFGRRNGALEDKRLSEVIPRFNAHKAFRKALEEDISSDIELEIPSIERRNTTCISRRLSSIKRKALSGFSMTSRKSSVSNEFVRNFSQTSRTSFARLNFDSRLCRNSGRRRDQRRGKQPAVFEGDSPKRPAMHHLIDDILELSFIESGGIALAPKSVNLHSLIEEIFTNLSAKPNSSALN
jgi:PAS domain-containing protein